MYIFIDESGNFSGDQDNYFVVGGFVTSDPRRTAKAFRKRQRSKFPKKIRAKTEVKFSDSGLNKEKRFQTLTYFTQQDLRIFYSFLNTKNIPLEFRKGNKIESGWLYAAIVVKTLELILPITESEFRVFLDSRRLKKLSQSEFKEYLRLNILPKLPAKTVIQIEIEDSTTNPNIQIADWVCGALYQYYTGKQQGKVFFDILHGNIMSSQELFKDYWWKSANKKPPHKN